jgi:hypothetical protein
MLVLTILLYENERILSLKPDVDGRSSSENGEFTGSGIPIVPGNAEIGKGTVIEYAGKLLRNLSIPSPTVAPEPVNSRGAARCTSGGEQ